MTPTEKQVQAGVVRFLRTVGFFVVDTSQPRASMITPGLSDLIVIGHGHVAFAEIKRPGGKQSPAQRSFQAEVEANGGEYHVWSSSEEAFRWYEDVRGRG